MLRDRTYARIAKETIFLFSTGTSLIISKQASTSNHGITIFGRNDVLCRRARRLELVQQGYQQLFFQLPDLWVVGVVIASY